MIAFAFQLRIVFANWLRRGLPPALELAALPLVEQPVALPAAPAAPVAVVPLRRVPQYPRATFTLPPHADWSAPAPDRRPQIHARGTGIIDETFNCSDPGARR